MRRAESAVVFGGLALRGWRLVVTGPFARGHDVRGHLDHARLVAAGTWLPEPGACWQCHQPPLAYLLGGGWLALAARLGLDEAAAWKGLQAISALASAGMLLVVAAALRRHLPAGPARLAALALVAAWPGLVLHAPNIGNDALLALLAAAALERLGAAWTGRPERADRRLLAAALLGLLALLAKASGLLVVLAILGTAAAVAFRDRRPGAILGPGLVLGLGGGALVAGGVLAPPWRAEAAVANAAALPEALRVPPGLGPFLRFDLATWFAEPFANPAAGEARASFLHELGKTALFGEWAWPGLLPWLLALGLSALLPAVALTTLAGLRPRRDLPFVLGGALLLGGVAALRLRLPYSTSADFRYVQALALPAAVAWARAVRAGPPAVARAARAAAWALVVLAALFALVAR